jgi:hypothetical protein
LVEMEEEAEAALAPVAEAGITASAMAEVVAAGLPTPVVRVVTP